MDGLFYAYACVRRFPNNLVNIPAVNLAAIGDPW
jgi:hypothetical protein